MFFGFIIFLDITFVKQYGRSKIIFGLFNFVALESPAIDNLIFKSTHTFISLPINYSDTAAHRDGLDTLRLSDLLSELRVTKKYFFNFRTNSH